MTKWQHLNGTEKKNRKKNRQTGTKLPGESLHQKPTKEKNKNTEVGLKTRTQEKREETDSYLRFILTPVVASGSYL